MADSESKALFKNVRILILEDNIADAEFLEQNLQNDGFVFISERVETKKSYIKALREFRPDIILSDYDLPNFSGSEALQIRKKISPDIPFILVTGAVGEERAIEILTGGATDYVLKKNLSRIGPPVKRALQEADEHIRRKIAEAQSDRLLKELEKRVQERTEDLQSEIELRKKAEEETRKTLESIGDGFFSCDQEWRFVYVNAQAERLLGIRQKDVIGKSHWDIFPLTLGTELENQYRLAAAGEARDFENFYKPWGRWFHNRCFPREGGGMSVYFQDVTHRKRAEEALRVSEERYRHLVQNTTAVILRMDPKGNILFANEHALELFGYTSDELIGKHAVGTIIPEMETTGRDLLAMVDEISRNPDRFHSNANENMRKNGKRVWMEWTNTGIYDTDGNLKEFLSVGIDVTERKRAEEALSQSETRYRILHENLRDAFVQIDMDGRITEFNDIFCQMLGYSPDEIIALPYKQLTPACWHSFEDGIVREQIISRGYSDVYEKEYRRKDGTLLPVELRTILLRDIARRPNAMWAIVRDITERKKAEKSLQKVKGELEERVKERTAELRAASHYARSLIEANLDPLVTISHEGKVTDVNNAAEQITGMKRNQLIGSDFSDYFTDPAKAKAGYEEVFQKGFVRDYELELKNQNGCSIPVLYNASVYRDKTGKILGVFAAARDITERKRAQEAIESERNRLYGVLETLPAMICLLKPDYHVVFANRAVRDRLGNTEGRLCYDYCFGHKEPCSFCESFRVLETGKPHHWEFSTPDSRVIETYNFPFYDVDSSPLILKMDLDITDFKKTQEELRLLNQSLENRVAERTAELEYANRELESFSYTVSHDLRAPLRAIDGFSRMLLQNEQWLDHETTRKLKIIRDNATKMDRLINDLLHLSRSARAPISSREIDMNRLVKGVWQEQLAASPDRRIELINRSMPNALGDEALIRQVLSNLAANAIKFSRRKKISMVEIGGEIKEMEAVYYIRDNGTGFNMQYYDKLFGVFQRLHSESDYEGTGVGLAIVQRIVNRHGGRIWADSKIGKGATFYFSLPAAKMNNAFLIK